MSACDHRHTVCGHARDADGICIGSAKPIEVIEACEDCGGLGQTHNPIGAMCSACYGTGRADADTTAEPYYLDNSGGK